MRPLIGIPVCLDDRGRWRPGRRYHYIDAAYAVAVETCGADAVYLPSNGAASAFADRIDGLLVPGGDDFSPPSPYPEDVRFDPVAPDQLAFDTELLRAALARGLPVLGICYGMQLLASLLGGELLYDIGNDVPDAGPHQLDPASGRHPISITPGSRLEAALGPAPEPVNSRHHQGVARAGDALCVSARTGDGLIEAVERPSAAFCVGVQWHPETLVGPHRDGLFGAFTEACRAGCERR